jgi:ATPase subunit of ABC transporter with duplicated ATPase domains
VPTNITTFLSPAGAAAAAPSPAPSAEAFAAAAAAGGDLRSAPHPKMKKVGTRIAAHRSSPGSARSRVLIVENLRKSYRSGAQQLAAVENVSFSVADGETVAMVGPSGRGKTTLLGLPASLSLRTLLLRLTTARKRIGPAASLDRSLRPSPRPEPLNH